ncbi:MAG: pimeloyl-ACP methyl ester carboxylesterase, partial [Myxococcota bacterium]
MGLLTGMVAELERLTPWLLERRGLARRRLDVPGGQIHLFDGQGRGDGPPILLLHGLGSRAADYGLLMARLRHRTRRLIAPDVPGHGSSPMLEGGITTRRVEAALLAAIDQVLDEPAIVIGNSMGGFAAVRFAQARPALTRALVLASPGGAPEEDLAGFLQRFDLQTRDDALWFIDRFLGRPSRLRSLLAAGVQGRMMAPGPRQLVAQVQPDDMLRPEELSQLAMPILMVWGREDEVLSPGQLAFYRRHLPPHATITT